MKIKNSLLDNATLAYYEVGVETEVTVDASPVGLGADPEEEGWSQTCHVHQQIT